MSTHEYWTKFNELVKLELILIPIHRSIQDQTYPSIAWIELNHNLDLMRTVPKGGF